MLAAALVLWFVYSRVTQHGFDWNLAATSLSRLRWGWLLLSLVPIFGTYYGRALRWAVFLKPLKPHPSIANLLSATIVGFTAITLFGRPGEFVRPYLIAVKEQVPVPSQFAAWVLERIFDLLMALLVFAFALTQVDSSRLHVGSQLTWVLAARRPDRRRRLRDPPGYPALPPALRRTRTAPPGERAALSSGNAIP